MTNPPPHFPRSPNYQPHTLSPVHCLGQHTCPGFSPDHCNSLQSHPIPFLAPHWSSPGWLCQCLALNSPVALHGPQNKGDAFSQAFKTFLNLAPANLSSWVFLSTPTLWPTGLLSTSCAHTHPPLSCEFAHSDDNLGCPPPHLYLSNSTASTKPSSGVTSPTKLPTLSTWEKRDIFS